MTHNSRVEDRRVLGPGPNGLTLEQARASNEWAYTVTCEACFRAGIKGSERALSWDWLIERFGPDYIVGNVRRRLKCKHCGGKKIVGGAMQLDYYNTVWKWKLESEGRM